MKFDVKGHWRSQSHKVSFVFTNHLFQQYIFCLTLLKLFKNVHIMKTWIFHEMKYDLQGHPRSYKTTFIPKSFMCIDIFWWKCVWMIISGRHNFFLNLYMTWIVILCYGDFCDYNLDLHSYRQLLSLFLYL